MGPVCTRTHACVASPPTLAPSILFSETPNKEKRRRLGTEKKPNPSERHALPVGHLHLNQIGCREDGRSETSPPSPEKHYVLRGYRAVSVISFVQMPSSMAFEL
ncbi:hypothetical protein GWI33_018265 [Rhynchophorus ferrugineus]|uniref:Uncharacterized protein n=1 Tax=Rhynchophorus ferrugineus TaxID=354439 RepID=A0A834HTS0_RHYFE|nr:hypothetical protein GWI33_018265 [Rhynchophorus ferrugineus]